MADRPAGELDRFTLEALMVGRELAQGYPRPRCLGRRSRCQFVTWATVLGSRGSLSTSLRVRSSVCRLMGSGPYRGGPGDLRLAGKIGRIEVAGRLLRRGDVRASIAAGIAFVTEDRRNEGLFLNGRSARASRSSASARVCRPFGRVDHAAERRLTKDLATAVALTARSGLEADGGSLSAATSRRFVLAKWLSGQPRLIILDEPTRASTSAPKPRSTGSWPISRAPERLSC